MRRHLAWLAVAVLVPSPLLASVSDAKPPSAAGSDVTVIAVVDDSFNPYHWDFLASRMPQHRDRDRSNDLPLNRPPHEWLSGFPKPSSFDSYTRFPITLPSSDPDDSIADLMEEDADRWEDVEHSTAGSVSYHWIPGTKFVGMLDFGAGSPLNTTSGHGVGTTSVSTGNIHGTCPECVVVFVRYGTDSQEAALRWAMSQPWIDVVTNSYGHGYGKVYDGPSRLDQRTASERGQTVVFSAGNGMENAYVVPNHTYVSSQKGPDWLITVGAVAPDGNNGSYSGAGKMVDVAGVGGSYPSAYTATTVGGTGRTGFSGTSNAAPTVAGTYARALHFARRDLAGPSRIQKNGVIAVGGRYRCGSARRACELGDGKLTAVELRTRLLQGAVHTTDGMSVQGVVAMPPVGEDEFMNEGHGTYLARLERDDEAWNDEFQRVLAPLEGRAAARQRPAGEREWMVVDSFCKQKKFGEWRGGYYVEGKTPVPASDPKWPVRSAMAAACTALPANGD